MSSDNWKKFEIWETFSHRWPVLNFSQYFLTSKSKDLYWCSYSAQYSSGEYPKDFLKESPIPIFTVRNFCGKVMIRFTGGGGVADTHP